MTGWVFPFCKHNINQVSDGLYATRTIQKTNVSYVIMNSESTIIRHGEGQFAQRCAHSPHDHYFGKHWLHHKYIQCRTRPEQQYPSYGIPHNPTLKMTLQVFPGRARRVSYCKSTARSISSRGQRHDTSRLLPTSTHTMCSQCCLAFFLNRVPNQHGRADCV